MQFLILFSLIYLGFGSSTMMREDLASKPEKRLSSFEKFLLVLFWPLDILVYIISSKEAINKDFE